MSGICELAKLFKERNNEKSYSPMTGEIIELPNLKIRLSEKIILTQDMIESTFNLFETDIDGKYIHKGKRVVLLPFANNQRFIAIGVIR